MFARSISKNGKTLWNKRNFHRSSTALGADHGHGHEHLMFEKDSFNARNVGIGIWSVVLGGIMGTLGICQFQNYKHGFPIKEEADSE